MSYFRKKLLNTDAFPVSSTRSRLQISLYWAALVTVLMLLQTKIAPFGLRLDLMVLIPFYTGLKKSPERGLLAGIGVGLLQDSLAGSILGPNILSKGAIGLASPLISGKLFVWTPLFGAAALFVMTVLDGVFAHLCKAIFLAPHSDLRSTAVLILFQAAVNAPIGYFIRPGESRK